MYNTEEPFWDKTLRLIRDIWPLGEHDELKDKVHAELPPADLNKLRKAIDECLEGRGGEVSARLRAAELGRAYLVLEPDGRRRFLELLALEYGVDNTAVEQAINERTKLPDGDDLEAANQQLRILLEPPRAKLLQQFNELQEGVKFLVDLRAELISWARNDSGLKALDRDVHRLLVSWFDIGFLDLRRITWDTQASILEKLIEYESVHEISSWKDLKNRLRADRRCYGFFHPRMPGEPLIFVEVALVNGISDNVQVLLDVNAPVSDPTKADTAIFYSISNCQRGLAGVSFGNFLIKRVVADLASKLPNLKKFSTLSPIPGFMKWLRSEPDRLPQEENDLQILHALLDADDPVVLLEDILVRAEEAGKTSRKERLEDLLLRLCAQYLVKTKRGVSAYDRVAHFHLSNGAHIERINWGGNMTVSGIEQSAGIMVNYLYDLTSIERNHELYTGKGEVKISSSVRKLLK